MKKELTKAINRIWMVIAVLLMNVVAFAQDKGIDVNVNMNKGDSWYNNPWVWVVGAAVFILLLVAIVRGGRASD
ncbi:MAG TPA: hypothetical protein VL093_01535 [Flavipsychrobacter sp.]|nr:hypothetical protein [Flavipsychrobacter sp.]